MSLPDDEIPKQKDDGTLEVPKMPTMSAEEMEEWFREDDYKLDEQVLSGSFYDFFSTKKQSFLSKVKENFINDKSKPLPFSAKGLGERFNLLAIVLFAMWLIPFTWSKSQDFVSGLLAVVGGILANSSTLVVGALGWGLLLYPVAITVTFVYCHHWINRFGQANQIYLMFDGLKVAWPSQLGKKLEWTDISSVFLFRPLETMLPDKWLVGFGTRGAQPVSVRLPVVTECGKDLLELLKTNCPWASVDPDLIELWEPAVADSHTELWIKSLTKAPKESELMPLFPGNHLKDGRYLILQRIGVGGQGTAYLVKDLIADKEVVVKETLFPVFVDPETKAAAQGRFQQELRLLEQLSHDNVVRMLDSFYDEHRGYLVLDYIDGETLRQLVKREGPLPEQRVIELLKQMSEILSYLHELSPPIIHRDFTPENLMLDKNGRLILIDFNVARQLESNKTATVVGKHAYIPPEQFRAEADTRSDIYACGATVHFLLTGEDPEPISQSHPAETNKNVSEKLDAIVARATAQDASQRYQKASEIIEDLN